MFDDVAASLRAHLIADVPLDPAEVDISFDRPTREWSSRLAGPTLSLFLFDIRERADFRDDSWRVTGIANGTVTRERPPRRIDLSYIVTAWTREPEDEQRILARVLASLYRSQRVAEEHLIGMLAHASLPLLVRAAPPDHQQKSVDFWGVMDNELRASLTWVATTPLDAFAPVTGPMVRTKEIIVGPRDDSPREQLVQVGGIVHKAGEPAEGIAGVHVSVRDMGLAARSDSAGRYTLSGITKGEHTLLVVPPDGDSLERTITVPSDSYDISVGKAAAPAGRKRDP